VILVAGLGNPGVRYAGNRHNIGFMVVDRLAGPGSAWRSQFSGEFAQIELEGERVGLLKPMTYMNESGRSVAAAVRYFRVPTDALVVVHDELDLAFGDVRLKVGGGEAGHRGLRSVSQHVGTSDYGRVRVGIGRPSPEFAGSGADYVLQAFPLDDRVALDNVLDRAADAVILIARSGWQAAMNEVNRRTQR
jgi:PTH1 family peptidyl-tRNA hydrolase